MPAVTLADPLYLRLSITDRCRFRCVYCATGGPPRTTARPRLTPAEIGEVVRVLSDRHGLAKVRITGGEPAEREGDLIEIIRRLRAANNSLELALTTNGAALARWAAPMAEAGLARVNVSLDSLSRDRFKQVTGFDCLDRVIAGIEAARQAGLNPVKLNAVVLRGINDQELPRLVSFAADRGCEIRFIEMMPMGPLADQWRDLFVPFAEMERALAGIVRHRRPHPDGPSPARTSEMTLCDGRRVTVGFITPMSCGFCSRCNRLRLAADGSLYTCLMEEPVSSLLSALRPRCDTGAIDRLVAESLRAKSPCSRKVGVGTMTHIGG
ncbi:MAG: GTP 3',8-cyclase MoaA [Pirellulaceae bacterium]